MASAQAEAVRQLLMQFREQVLGLENPTLEQMRENGEGFGELTGEPSGVRWEDEEVAGLPCKWAIPEGADEGAVVQYVHGGGYVIGSIEGYRKLTGHIALSVGCRVLSVGYRLAPENPHPGPVNDSVAVYRELLARGFSPSRIAISGDSAGGGLTMATLLKIRDDGLAAPAAGVPMSPWVDLEGTGASMASKADLDLIVGVEALKGMADLFLAGKDARDPLAAPLHADLRGLPALYIQVGGHETLLDDATRLAANAATADVEVRLDVFPEMQHVFQVAAGNVPEADDAIARIGQWLRPRLGIK